PWDWRLWQPVFTKGPSDAHRRRQLFTFLPLPFAPPLRFLGQIPPGDRPSLRWRCSQHPEFTGKGVCNGREWRESRRSDGWEESVDLGCEAVEGGCIREEERAACAVAGQRK